MAKKLALVLPALGLIAVVAGWIMRRPSESRAIRGDAQAGRQTSTQAPVGDRATATDGAKATSSGETPRSVGPEVVGGLKSLPYGIGRNDLASTLATSTDVGERVKAAFFLGSFLQKGGEDEVAGLQALKNALLSDAADEVRSASFSGLLSHGSKETFIFLMERLLAERPSTQLMFLQELCELEGKKYAALLSRSVPTEALPAEVAPRRDLCRRTVRELSQSTSDPAVRRAAEEAIPRLLSE